MRARRRRTSPASIGSCAAAPGTAIRATSRPPTGSPTIPITALPPTAGSDACARRIDRRPLCWRWPRPAAAGPDGRAGIHAGRSCGSRAPIFAGLARDGDSLLVTDLAAGRLYRRGPDGRFTAPVRCCRTAWMRSATRRGPIASRGRAQATIVAQGWTPANTEESRYDHALLEVGEDAGVKVVSSDFWNPYDFVTASDGFYVIDAARSSVERLSADGGEADALHLCPGSPPADPRSSPCRRPNSARSRTTRSTPSRPASPCAATASTCRCSAAFRSWPAAATSFLAGGRRRARPRVEAGRS